MRVLLQNVKSISGPPTGHPLYAMQSLTDAVTAERLLSGEVNRESFANDFSQPFLRQGVISELAETLL